MEYIVLDLEWNQPFPYNRSHESGLSAEIIEIGAVKICGGQMTDSFCSFVKPKYHKKLHPWVKRLTGITPGDIDGGQGFPEAIEAFRRWCGGAEAFLTWGFDDIPVLCQNLQFYRLDTGWLAHWYNLQMIFNLQTGQPPGQKSLPFALEHMGIHPPGQMHDALTDADCTARIARKLDVQKGIAEYEKCIRANKTASMEHAAQPETAKQGRHTQWGSRGQALKDKNLARLCCPRCRELMEEKAFWVRQNTGKYIALARCPQHGAYLFRLKLSRLPSGGWRAGRVVWQADEKMQQLYQAKLSKAPRLEKRRKACASGARE